MAKERKGQAKAGEVFGPSLEEWRERAERAEAELADLRRRIGRALADGT